MVSPLGVSLVSPTSCLLPKVPLVSNTRFVVLLKSTTLKTSLSPRASLFVRPDVTTTLSFATKLLLDLHTPLTGGVFHCVLYLYLLCCINFKLVQTVLGRILCILLLTGTSLSDVYKSMQLTSLWKSTLFYGSTLVNIRHCALTGALFGCALL